MMNVFMNVPTVQGVGLPIFADTRRGAAPSNGIFLAEKAYTRPPDDLGDETMMN
ncbi:hypothetical protein [Lihuaxuella thermophila]|uniref:Uncharacterized protein n=1 Tax=Lihuaxuella thermophila TaxID=1173111 RepID=A0A1H8HT81_9BACL|nr:hypothetical protein [Lihuaxuella thermophila]SEN59510.1 hypothetical protein SAMN05444955_11537 [Lihuaxuella thermophila]